MNLTDILVIVGCVAVGYWIVSSVMGPGIDITRRPPEGGKPAPPKAEELREPPWTVPPRPPGPGKLQRPADRRPAQRALPRPAQPTPIRKSLPSSMRKAPAASAPSTGDWYLLLDVSSNSTRREIEAAFQHQLRKAQDARDTMLQERLRRARDAGLAAVK